jgi:hypothetical protein
MTKRNIACPGEMLPVPEKCRLFVGKCCLSRHSIELY